MRAIFLAIFLVVLAQASPQEDAKKAERIRQALVWLENSDIEVREMGRKDLVELGAAAIPALEKKLEEKGALPLARLFREIDRPKPPSEPWIAEKDLQDLKADEQFLKELEKMPKDAPAKYVHVKYQEAMAQTRSKNYQRGFDLANALLVLEPRSANTDAIKRLRRYCESMITQTTLIEAKVIQPKLWYVEGEAVELSIRMKNLYRNTMTLTYDKGSPGLPGGGLVVIEVEAKIFELGGASISETRHQEIRIEEEVPIAPGAQWERKFTVDFTSTVEDKEQIRLLTINAWTHPLKIAADGANVTRRIQFEPAVVRFIPKKYSVFLENPLEWLGKTMDKGTVQEVFICSQMLEGEQRDQGAEMLIRSMEKAANGAARNEVAKILSALTGQQLGADPKRWLEWYQNKGKDKDKDKNKK